MPFALRHPLAAVFATAGILLLPVAPAAIADDDDPIPPPPVSPGVLAPHLVSGQITDLEASAFQIRPWLAPMPRRIQVTTTPGVVYFRQKLGEARKIEVGELVLVVQEKQAERKAEAERKLAERPATDDDETETREPHSTAARPVEAIGVLRLGPGKLQDLERKDRWRAQALLESARPWFKGENRGGVVAPGPRTVESFGVVTSLKPLTVETRRGVRYFRISSRSLIIENHPAVVGDLKKGLCITVQCAARPGAEAAVEATLVAIGPKPRLSPGQERRLQERERGKPRKSTGTP